MRPDWNEYWMGMVDQVSKRGTCDRGRVGCVFVRNNEILVTGYVGAPAGFEHCDEVGHQIKTVIHEDGTQSQHCTRTVHCELAAIARAAKRGISLDGSTIYVGFTPCTTCAKVLISVGVKNIICKKKYHVAPESEEIFKQANIPITYLSEEIEKY